jgi:hypothetical protein
MADRSPGGSLPSTGIGLPSIDLPRYGEGFGRVNDLPTWIRFENAYNGAPTYIRRLDKLPGDNEVYGTGRGAAYRAEKEALEKARANPPIVDDVDIASVAVAVMRQGSGAGTVAQVAARFVPWLRAILAAVGVAELFSILDKILREQGWDLADIYQAQQVVYAVLVIQGGLLDVKHPQLPEVVLSPVLAPENEVYSPPGAAPAAKIGDPITGISAKDKALLSGKYKTRDGGLVSVGAKDIGKESDSKVRTTITVKPAEGAGVQVPEFPSILTPSRAAEQYDVISRAIERAVAQARAETARWTLPNVPPGMIPAGLFIPPFLLRYVTNSAGVQDYVTTQPASDVRAQQLATALASTAMPDGKTQDMRRYLAVQQFITRTWGKVSELLDFAEVAQRNTWVRWQGSQVRLSQLAWNDRVLLLQQVAYGRADLMVDGDQLMVDLFTMQLEDVLWAQFSRVENAMMSKMFTDSHLFRNVMGNPSTWGSRAAKLLGG